MAGIRYGDAYSCGNRGVGDILRERLADFIWSFCAAFFLFWVGWKFVKNIVQVFTTGLNARQFWLTVAIALFVAVGMSWEGKQPGG
jgi:hypothetical protein